MSQWLYAAMRAAGLAVELLETRHLCDAFKAMPVKSDRNDARGIAQLMRLGWFRPVHCKSMAAQEMHALLTARKLVQSKVAQQGLTHERCRSQLTRSKKNSLHLRGHPHMWTVRVRFSRSREKAQSSLHATC